MRAGFLPDSDEFLTVEDALLLITWFTTLDLRYMPRFSREQNEQALRDAYESGTVMLQDEESMRIGNPSKHLDSTRPRVTAEIKSTPLAAISARLWISLTDFRRFTELHCGQHDFLGDELIKNVTLYDVENELGYTIRGAARALAKKYPVPARAMAQRIFEAAEQGMLHVSDPQTGLPYTPKKRSYRHERISVFELNQWLEQSGASYRLGKDAADEPAAVAAKGAPEDEPAATPATRPQDIDRRAVMRIFCVRPNKEWENRRFWDDKLGRPPAWLAAARTFEGRPGVSSRWDPLLVAHALLYKEHMNLQQLDSAIHEHLHDLMEQWKEETYDKRNEDENADD